MNENENLVANEATENAEQTAEQPPKLYTIDEVNEIAGKRAARKEAKIRKEYERKYGDLEEVLKAGTGKESVDEMTDTFKKFYQSKGIKIPEKADYSAKDIDTLARADAEDIIRSGYEEVVEEADRLNELGAERMTAREKAVFRVLTEHIKNTETGKQFAEIGVTEDVYNSKEFKEFQSMFKSDVPLTKVYEQYQKTQPKKEIRTMGSMKNSNSDDNGVKDFYSPEEARKFTRKELDENPALFAAIEKSMRKWR